MLIASIKNIGLRDKSISDETQMSSIWLVVLGPCQVGVWILWNSIKLVRLAALRLVNI